MINKFKNKLFLTLLAILLILLLIVILLPSKKTGQIPTTITIPSFNQQASPPTTQVETDNFAVSQRLATVYQLTFTDQQIRDFFQSIAQDLSLTSPPENIDIDQKPHLFWDAAPNFLTVNLATSAFTLDLRQGSNVETKVTQADALLFVKNWLSRYDLIQDSWSHQVQYFADAKDELVPQSDPTSADAYLFSFSPNLNNLPLFNTESIGTEFPVNVTIDAFGNILSVYYQLPAIFFADKASTSSIAKSLLTSKQIEQKIAENKPIITAINFTNDQFVPSTENLSNVVYNRVVLGYSSDVSNGYLLPIFQLTGAGILESGEKVNVTAYLPALAE